jgi:hypothetical protein
MVSGVLGREIAVKSIFVVENQKLTLSQRAQLHKEVTAIYEITPRTTSKGLSVLFYNFAGIEVVSKDTIFTFNADSGVTRRFTVKLKYNSTPATFWVRVSDHIVVYTGDNRIALTRYLLNIKTGEYGSMKEIQYNRTLEYCFNPHLKKFEQEVFSFEKDRWQRNRAIIDTLKGIADISDSLALLLYSEIPKVIYPPKIVAWIQQARYLLKEGWQEYESASERQVFLEQLSQRNVEYIEKLEKEKIEAQRVDKIKWTMSWLLPVVALVGLVVLLLMVRSRRKSAAITSAVFDRIIAAIVLILVVGLIVYLAWPRLSVREEMSRRGKQEYERVMKEQTEQARLAFAEVEHLNLFGGLRDCDFVSKDYRHSRKGIIVVYEYKNVQDSKIGVEYHFSVTAEPTDTGYKAVIPAYSPSSAIEKLEAHDRVAGFLLKNHIKEVYLRLGNTDFAVSIHDTIIEEGTRIPVCLEYNSANDAITKYVVASSFDDENYPEIRRLKSLCAQSGYPVRNDVAIMYKQRAYGSAPGLATLIEGSGDDTLWVYFFSDKPDDFTFQWIPVPRNATPPQQILDQLYTEFARVGLPLGYAKDNLKIVSACGLRCPNYFQKKGDRVILKAAIKWMTGVKWVDELNNGEGVRFMVAYEYFADSLKLGKSLHGQIETGYKEYHLRPIRKIIPYKEARDILFANLPDEGSLVNMIAQLHISAGVTSEGDFIYLVSAYHPTTPDAHCPRCIRVDLETGEVKK